MAKKPLHYEIIDPAELAKGIFLKQITPVVLPKNVYLYNAEKLKQGLYKGYKKSIVSVSFDSPDYKMLASLRANIYMFSAAKTFQQTLDMSNALTAGGHIVPFDKFRDYVKEVSDQYNGEEVGQWLNTEWNTAIDSGRQAAFWTKAQERKEALPNMTYHTDQQDTVCEICGGCDGVTLPMEDGFWDENYPPQHFSCHCYVTQEEEDVELTDEDEVSDIEAQIATTNKQPMFKQNVGKSGEMFNKEHPYFIVPEKYKEFARRNFGLAIPKND